MRVITDVRMAGTGSGSYPMAEFGTKTSGFYLQEMLPTTLDNLSEQSGRDRSE
jgi:hypothetical protein